MFNRLPYLVAEAFRGLLRHRLVIIPSLATTFLCSFLLIASLSALNFAFSLSGHTASLYRIEAFFAEAPKQSEADSILSIVAGMENISSLNFVSEEEALAEFKKTFPDEMLYLIEGNPLPASLRIQLAASAQNVNTVQGIIESLQAFPEISVAQAPIDWIERWENFKWHFFAIPTTISALMLGILWLIMWNAVRLTLISRKDLVENIKYSGGTPFFMQFPFVLEGLFQGLAGAGCAALFYNFLEKTVLDYFPLFTQFAHNSLVSLFVLVFVAISEAAVSFFTVRKFLQRGF